MHTHTDSRVRRMARRRGGRESIDRQQLDTQAIRETDRIQQCIQHARSSSSSPVILCRLSLTRPCLPPSFSLCPFPCFSSLLLLLSCRAGVQGADGQSVPGRFVHGPAQERRLHVLAGNHHRTGRSDEHTSTRTRAITETSTHR